MMDEREISGVDVGVGGVGCGVGIGVGVGVARSALRTGAGRWGRWLPVLVALVVAGCASKPAPVVIEPPPVPPAPVIKPAPRIGLALGGGAAGLVAACCFAALWWRGYFNVKASKTPRIDWSIARQLAVIGTPAVLEQGMVQLAFLAFFGIVASYGTDAYAAYGIGVSLVSFSIVVGFGFGIAAATLVGQQLGAGRPDLAVAAGWRALRLALLAMGSMAALQIVYARDLASFMIDDPRVVELTVVFIYLLAASQPLMACELTLAGALRGAGDTRFPLFSTFCGMILGRLLPAWLFLHLGLSVYWIYAVMLADYSTKACLLLHRYRSRKWLGGAIDEAEVVTMDSTRKNT